MNPALSLPSPAARRILKLAPRTTRPAPEPTSPALPVLKPTSNPIAAAPLPSNDLLQGRKTIEISHNGSVYRLQATKLGKLILTK